MKLSENTIAILKNFSFINSNMVLNPGHTQATVSPASTIMAEADLDEEIPVKFGIFELQTFISNLSMFDREIEFSEGFVEMKSGKFALKYYGCEPSILKQKTKDIPLENPDATFTIQWDDLDRMLKIAAMNSLDNITFFSNEDGVFMKIHDKNVKDSHSGIVKIHDEAPAVPFECAFATANLKLLPINYKVEVKAGAFAKFTSEDTKIRYYIAIQI